MCDLRQLHSMLGLTARSLRSYPRATVLMLLLRLSVLVTPVSGEQWTDPCEEAAAQSATVDHTHALLGQVLSTHVSSGMSAGIAVNLVDYAALKTDPSLLRSYLQQLCHVDLASLDDARKLALLINAYNAVMMAMVVAYDIQGSVWDVQNIFGIQFATVGGEKRSLDNLEHDMIRGRYSCNTMDSPGLSTRLGVSGRIHAAVNCASLSCPDLRLEPFVHDRLEAQLTSAARAWMADSTKNPGLENGELRLSKIFDWYGCDMELESGSTIQQWVMEHSDWMIPSSTSISYLDYNWDLNAATNIRTGSGLPANGGERGHAPLWTFASLLLGASLLRQITA
mmetsp:Transcript_60861/g.145065  ORF Transcript_60861/g.145065 Transcript_60861/m.145065 type:complete len:338 (-) Transcript_60861:10-1023(-)